MKPILYINKKLYLRVCYILKNVLPKMGFSPFSLSVQAGKKGGMKFKTSNAHNFLIDYPIFTNKDSKCSADL
jgi:hypothetical protein